MATDFNNKNIGTVSNKLRKMPLLKRYIIDKIDENQDIKRLTRYPNISPLSESSLDYSGNLINQPDLKLTLKEDNVEGDKVLFAHGFNPDMENEKKIYIFVQNYTNDFKNLIGNNKFYVHILCPECYNDLAFYGQERIYEIAIKIIDILDEHTIEGDLQKELGMIKFEVSGTGDEGRMAKSKDVIRYSFPVIAKTMNTRTRVYE
ncbi:MULTISPECIES: hypothetical protein [unclassified Clostridium]|uniref:hypothetical protein n=1 Tax=unclassified Clostridium TaxID=2614128 RepID=UPI0025C3AA21|nr:MULTISPECIES: hypothetical protein [unclassified Clostridium]